MDTQQNLTTNFRPLIDFTKDMSPFKETLELKDFQWDETTKSEETSATDVDQFSNEMSIWDADPESLRSLQIFVFDQYPLYLIDYSFPAEMNEDGFSMRFGDLKVDYLKKTRLALVFSASGLSITMVVALLTLPHPYNLASLALCGPLFVSTYGLLTQK